MVVVPVSIGDASLLVDRIHRHRSRPVGGLFALAVAIGDHIHGVAIVGRPVARHLQDGFTAEVTRLATDGTKNANSKLYAAAWRAARALGYRRLVTYVLASEPGTSLRAAGWRCVGTVRGRSWDTPSRPRIDKYLQQDKFRWEVCNLDATLAENQEPTR